VPIAPLGRLTDSTSYPVALSRATSRGPPSVPYSCHGPVDCACARPAATVATSTTARAALKIHLVIFVRLPVPSDTDRTYKPSGSDRNRMTGSAGLTEARSPDTSGWPNGCKRDVSDSPLLLAVSTAPGPLFESVASRIVSVF